MNFKKFLKVEERAFKMATKIQRSEEAQKNFLEKFRFIDPDKIFHFESITFIYANKDKKLWTEDYIAHWDMVEENEEIINSIYTPEQRERYEQYT